MPLGDGTGPIWANRESSRESGENPAGLGRRNGRCRGYGRSSGRNQKNRGLGKGFGHAYGRSNLSSQHEFGNEMKYIEHLQEELTRIKDMLNMKSAHKTD